MVVKDTKADVTFTIGTELSRKDLDETTKILQKRMLALQTAANKIKFRGGVLDQFKGQKDAAVKSMFAVRDAMAQTSVALTDTKQKLMDTDKRLRGTFRGWALGIMFFGKAVQTTFTNIWRSSLRTFNTVSNSIEDNITQFQMLNGSMELLRFNIGQALEPIAMFLIPIVDNVANWVLQNEEAVRSIFLIGTVAGTVLGIGGTAILAIDATAAAFANITEAARHIIPTIKNLDWASIGSAIKTGIGVIAITYSVVQAVDAFDDITKGNFGNALLNALSGAALAIGGIKLLRGAKGGGVLIAIGVGLELIEQGRLIQTIGAVFVPIAALLETFVDMISEMFTDGIVKGIINGFSEALELLIFKFPGLSDLLGFDISDMLEELTGLDISKEFDFGLQFKKNFIEASEGAKFYDQEISRLINNLNNLDERFRTDIAINSGITQTPAPQSNVTNIVLPDGSLTQISEDSSIRELRETIERFR